MQKGQTMSDLSDFLTQIEEALRQHESEPQGRVYVNVALTSAGLSVRGSRNSGFMMIRSEKLIPWDILLASRSAAGVLLKTKIGDVRRALLEPRA